MGGDCDDNTILAVCGRSHDHPIQATPDIFDRRRQCIEEIEREENATLLKPGPHPLPKAPQMWFFYDLDRSTNPDRLQGAAKRKMQALTHLLRVRLKCRARAKVRGQRFVETRPECEETHTTALGVAQLLAAGIAKAFGDISAPANLKKFDACFEDFVCGDLALGGIVDELQRHGEPDGINYLLFAQFALYLSELDPEEQRRPVWTRALATFVRTSEIFLDLYWNGGGRTFASYGFAWRNGREFPAEKRERLRTAYVAVSTAGNAALGERFNLLCAFALRDGIGCEANQPEGGER
jgi:hypothetical protein